MDEEVAWEKLIAEAEMYIHTKENEKKKKNKYGRVKVCFGKKRK